MARIIRKIQDFEFVARGTIQKLNRKGELLSEVAGISPPQAMVIALISLGVKPDTAVNAARSLVITLSNQGNIANPNSALASFDEDKELKELINYEAPALTKDLNLLALELIRNPADTDARKH